MNITNVFTASLEGIALAVWPIILVIIAAVFIYNLSIYTGSMDIIKRIMTSVTTAATSMVGSEGKILSSALKVCLFYIVIAGSLVFFCGAIFGF